MPALTEQFSPPTYPIARSSRHYADQPTLPIQLKMTLLPVAARIASLVLLGAAVQLCAETTTSLTHSPKPAPDLAAPPASASTPDQTAAMPELKLVAQFDVNGDLRLDSAERKAALAYLAQHPPAEAPTPTGRPAPVQPVSAALEPVKRGQTVTPDQVAKFPGEELYGTKKIRTLFLTFAEDDWEKELAEFARTDVQLPARLEVDGRIVDGVGVHFRRPAQGEVFPVGYKRSLRLALDYTDAGQQLAGHHQLELLASASDPTFLRTLLYHQMCQGFITAPADSLVRVVINGEDWGIYTNPEPFDAAFIQEKFGKQEGAFWTAGPGANLDYLGDDPAAYRSRYRLESPENPAAWAKLIQLCKVLHQAPDDDTGHVLAALIDIDSTVRFLALQNALINQDGYGWPGGSYGLYLAGDGRFHFVPLAAEHSFRLLQVTEYSKPTRSRGSASGDRHGGNGGGTPEGKTGSSEEKEAALLRPYLHKDYPKQSGTNLAVLLSHSLINKADSNQDDKVTAEEWHAFAISWFIIMDEDSIGRLTRDQFIAKIRLLVTPPSVIDGRTKQTFGSDDAAAQIGGDFLKEIDADHDGYVTREEMVAAFDHLFVEWTAPGPKSPGLTQPVLEKGLTTLFTKSVYAADQSFIAMSKTKAVGAEEDQGGKHGGHGGGKHGGGGGGEGGGGTGANLGPIHLGLPKHGGGEESSRTVMTFGEQLDPLDGNQDATKPLLDQLLSLPAWRTRYQNYLSQITNDSLLWTQLGPVAKEYHDSIAAEVRQDTHKPFSYERFVQELDQDPAQERGSQDENPSLKSFLVTRRSYLMRNGGDSDGN